MAVYNRTASVTDAFVSGPAKGMSIIGTHSLAEMAAALKRPRRVMMLVKAGQPVDDFIEKLIPLLEPGDIIIDGGNSNYDDSIRLVFLGKIKDAFDANPGLANLLLDPFFQGKMAAAEGPWRRVVAAAVQLGIPVAALGSALTFYDGYRRERLPANLTQAQRDYFGAHTYERIDRPRGQYYPTNWTGRGGDVTSRACQA